VSRDFDTAQVSPNVPTFRVVTHLENLKKKQKSQGI